MTNALRLAVFILSITLANPAGTAGTPVSPASQTSKTTTTVATPPTVEARKHEVHSESAMSVELIERVLDRFATLGLELPPMEFHFHTTSGPCDGNKGLHTSNGDSHRIDLCRSGSIDTLLLHEIAHVWIGDNVVSNDRSQFLAMRGLRTWNEPDTEWRYRGTEHAAQIVAWGLSEECSRPQWIGQTEPADLFEAFVYLTGEEPICRPGDKIKVQARNAGGLGGVQS